MKSPKKTYRKILKNPSSGAAVLGGLLLVSLGTVWLLFSIAPHADTSTTASFQVENGLS